MDYDEAVEFLFDLRRFRPRPGTASTADFLAWLGDPHEDVDFVQVAGSNGKGSTARFCERILRETGISVGLYTSPHLEDVRERVQVDGRAIPRSAVTEFVETSREYITDQAATGTPPTFFETLTTMALWHFGRTDVDVGVLEVGIGGRYDATSVVDPVASAVTSVTLEHTGIIGETETEIARDKAHVAPADGPLVTAVRGDTLAVIEDVAGAVRTVGFADDRDVTVSYGGPRDGAEAAVTIESDGKRHETHISLLGRHQAENAGVAVALAEQVATVDDEAICRGLRKSHWPGRFEIMERAPLVVLDGAHNPGACRQLAETLETLDYDELHLVVGAMHDKDHAAMAEALPTVTSVVACEPTIDRAEDRSVLARVFENAGVGHVETAETVRDGLAGALERASGDDCVLVTGSLFAVAEARRHWAGRLVPHDIGDAGEATSVLERITADTDRRSEALCHRVLTTRLEPRTAAEVERALVRAGGECVVAASTHHEEPVDVLLSGTDVELDELADRLAARQAGTADLVRRLREKDTSTTGGDRYPWHERPAVMGILNVTPDSFHDGGAYETVADAADRAHEMVAAGADIVDVGGESTRPGARPVPVEEEIDRVVPVIEEIGDVDALISVDTRKAAVAEAALSAGADLVNDVSGLEDPEMRFVAADHDAALVLMHSIETPVDPDTSVTYDDVVTDVLGDLGERVLLAEQAGLDREQLVVDPGFGFGKRSEESFELLARLGELTALGCPIMVGHSHKSMFELVDRGPDERFAPTVAASALAVARGADIVRVHDVDATVAAVETALALER